MKFEHENDYLKVLLDACLEVQQNPDYSLGICSNIVEVLPYYISCDAEYILRGIRNILFKEWPKYSGDENYPVPPLNTDSAHGYFSHTWNYWEGAYGDLRKELLQFMIDSLKLALKTK